MRKEGRGDLATFTLKKLMEKGLVRGLRKCGGERKNQKDAF